MASTELDRTPVPEMDEGFLRVTLLGRFEVSVGSRVVGEEGWRLRKAAGLVKLLAFAPHHRLHREQAMELLWPDPQVRREQPPPDPPRRPAHARARGAKATLSFTGTEVAWVAPKSKAVVFLDGAKVATVDLFSTRTLARQIVFSRGNLDPATTHTLEVRNLGTAGRSRVDVDAFVVVR